MPTPERSRGASRRTPTQRLVTRAVLLPVQSAWRRATLRWIGRIGVVGALVWAGLVGVREAHDYATTAPRFEVRALIYEPTPHVPDDRLRELLALEPGTNVLALDLDELAARVVSEPWVASATVTRELPDTIAVTVEEHEPVAVLLSGYFYLVSRAGRPFKRLDRGEREALPIITGVDRELLVNDGAAAQERIDRALEVLEAYGAKQRPRLSEVHVGPAGEVDLYTAELGTQLRLGRGEIGPKLDRLDALRAALGADVDTLAVVHLDGSTGPGRKDRVVASFFSAEEPALLAQAQDTPDDDAAAEPASPDKGRGGESAGKRTRKKKRIPRYE